MIRQNFRFAALALIPAVVFSPLWWRAFIIVHGSAVAAPGYDWAGVANPDPLMGTLGNGLRYLFESVDLTRAVDIICVWLAGFSPRNALQGLYNSTLEPLFGLSGAAVPFILNWLPDETLAWFGPLAFCMVFPAVRYALWRGPRRLKAVAVALCGYFYLVCLVLVWRPGNARYFSIFFACGRFFMAFLLPPWRLSHKGKTVLQVFSLLLFAYACLGSIDRFPFTGRINTAGRIGWLNSRAITNWSGNRMNGAGGSSAVEGVHQIYGSIFSGERVGLAVNTRVPTYAFLPERRRVGFIPLGGDNLMPGEAFTRVDLDFPVHDGSTGDSERFPSNPQGRPRRS